MDCMDCKICNVPYDEEDHRPRNSRCGHEFCSACLKALISNGTFTCPKCRMTSEVNDPDDLPVNFGLIDVIREFKTQNGSLTQKSEVCYEHFKDVKYRCLNCNTWICEECLDLTKKHTGCDGTKFNIRSASYAISSMKELETKDIRSLLTCFEEKVNYVPSLIQGHTDKIQELGDMGEEIIEKANKQKKEILDSAVKQCKEIMEVAETRRENLLERAKKHEKEIEKLYNLLEQGNKHNENLVEWDKHLQSTCSPYRMMDNTAILTESKQQMKNCLQSLEDYTLILILKAVKENKEVCFEMVTKDKTLYGKLSQHEENVYLYYLRNQIISDSSISIPFPQFHPMIKEASLIFLELSLGEVVKGHVLVRLNKDSPNIRENMVKIVTGKGGKSLADTELCYLDKNTMKTCHHLPFSDIPVTPDERIIEPGEKCNIAGYYGEGYLRIMYFSVIQRNNKSTGQYAIGHIESGIDILKECNNKLQECHGFNNNCECNIVCGQSCIYPSKRLKITDCGIVLEKQE